MPWRLSIPQRFAQFTIQLLDGLTGLSGAVAAQPRGGFSLDDAWTHIAHTRSLDQATVTSWDPTKQYTSVGWLVFLAGMNPGSKSAPATSLGPVTIRELVAISDNGVLEGFGDYALPAGNSTQHQIQPLGNVNDYRNGVTASANGLQLNDLEFYQDHTQLVFFSRTQLLMAEDTLPSPLSRDASILLFSGFELFTGRVGSTNAMREYRSLYQNQVTPDHWFSLKMEVVLKPDLVPSLSSAPRSNSAPTGFYNDYRPGMRGACQPAASGGGGSSFTPMSHYGQPCPPEWDYLQSVTRSTFAALGTPLDGDSFCTVAGMLGNKGELSMP